MHRVVAQQVRVGLDRAEIVDGHDLDVLAAGLGDGAQDVAADAAEPVDGDPDGHSLLLPAVVMPGLCRASTSSLE